MSRILLALCIAGLVARSAAAQTTVSLNVSARIAATGPIKLSDIATLTGPDAGALGAITIMDRPPQTGEESRWSEIDLGTVRRVLESEKVNMGRTVLKGTVCTARFAAPPAAPLPTTEEPRPPSTPADAAMPGAPKVREYIAASLASLYHAKPEDLRLSFDARDQPLLNSSPTARRISVEPTGTGGSGTMTVRVCQYTGDREVSSDAVSVRVLIRRDVVTTSTSIERGQTIDSAMLNRAEQWLSPAAATPALYAEASGRTARVRIGGGQTITRDMVESPYVVQKGEFVEVHCLCGAVQVKASRARAQDKARDGEMVLLKLEGAAKTFQARMNGPGKAVMVLDDETNQ